MTPPKPIYSYVAAAALAFVTVFTFYVLRNFGPQSAIRRFHVAAWNGNIGQINTVSLQPFSSSTPTGALVAFVQELVQVNATYDIQSIRFLPKTSGRDPEVIASVEYVAPNGRRKYVAWHVVELPGEWRVDCRATWDELVAQSLRAGNGMTPG